MPEMNREEIAKLEALYESNPEGRVFTHLAEAYRKAGDYERARGILERGLEKHPAYASAHVVLGRVFADLNDIPQARASFRHVLDLDPHNLVALRSLGDLARATGNRDEALGYFEELRHQDPGNDEVDRIVDELKREPAAPQPAAEPAEAPPEEEAVAGAGQIQGTFEEPSFASESVAEAPAAAAEGLDELPGFEAVQPDYGDLVSPDIDLGWTAGAESGAEVLPGDLGDLVSEAADTPELLPEPVHEPAPETVEIDLSDLEQPEEEITYDTLESVELPAPEPPFWEQAEEPETQTEPEPVRASEPAAEPAAEATPGVPVWTEPVSAAAGEAEDSPPDDLVTETMAELLVGQGLHEAAADVYRALIRERPWDPDLKKRLADVEALAQPVKRPAPEAEPLREPEPEPAHFEFTAPEAADPETEPESPWTSAPAVGASAATPYAWTDEPAGTGDEDAGPSITDYFRSLLSWRPGSAPAAPVAAAPQRITVEAEPEPEVANFEPTPETANQPAVIELATPAPDEAAAADQLMPWEAPEPPAQILAPTPATPKKGDNPVDAAFDEWFNAPEESAAQGQDGAAPEEGEGEDDDDLEMFRSWLQSLKK